MRMDFIPDTQKTLPIKQKINQYLESKNHFTVVTVAANDYEVLYKALSPQYQLAYRDGIPYRSVTLVKAA